MVKPQRISLLHLALAPGDLRHNRALVKRAVQVAAQRGADWAISPELCTCGLQFHAQLLICADAYTRDIAASLKSQGADLLVSSAAWGPGLHGPEGEWEQRTVETGLPLIVCNRTGKDHTVSFMGAESLVVKNGKRLLAHHSERSAVLTFDWNWVTMEPMSNEYHKDYL